MPYHLYDSINCGYITLFTSKSIHYFEGIIPLENYGMRDVVQAYYMKARLLNYYNKDFDIHYIDYTGVIVVDCDIPSVQRFINFSKSMDAYMTHELVNEKTVQFIDGCNKRYIAYFHTNNTLGKIFSKSSAVTDILFSSMDSYLPSPHSPEFFYASDNIEKISILKLLADNDLCRVFVYDTKNNIAVSQ